MCQRLSFLAALLVYLETNSLASIPQVALLLGGGCGIWVWCGLYGCGGAAYMGVCGLYGCGGVAYMGGCGCKTKETETRTMGLLCPEHTPY